MTTIDPQRLRSSLLLVNEAQRGLTDPALASNTGLAAECERLDVIANIAALAATCREVGIPVVYNTMAMRPDRLGTSATCRLMGSVRKRGTLVRGEPAAQLHPALGVQPSDYVIERVTGLTPFHGTDLEQIMRAARLDTVIVTGVSTNIGIPGACLEAVNRAMHAIVPSDCVAAAFPEAQDFMLVHMLPLLATVVTSRSLIEQLRTAFAAA